MKQSDVLIIGGGLAGMTAAIYAARANLSVTIVEKEVCGGLANWTYVVENFPSYESVNGLELMMKVKEHVLSLGVEIEEVDEITSVELEGPLKIARSAEAEYAGKTAILATGRVPIRIPLGDTWEDHIHYCSVCDGTAYKGKEVVVIGGGNSGFDESLYLIGLGVTKVTIVEFMDNCVASETTQIKAAETGKIDVLTSTKVVTTAPKGNRGLITLEDAKTGEQRTLEADGLFVFIGQKPNTALFKDIITMDRGYIVANVDMETNIPGVFAAGDVTVKRFRQLTTAMNDGTIAALMAEAYLRAQGAK